MNETQKNHSEPNAHFWYSEKAAIQRAKLGEPRLLATINGHIVEFTEQRLFKQPLGTFLDLQYLGEGEFHSWNY